MTQHGHGRLQERQSPQVALRLWDSMVERRYETGKGRINGRRNRRARSTSRAAKLQVANRRSLYAADLVVDIVHQDE